MKVAQYGNCNHMFTLLLDRGQIDRFLVEQSEWLDEHSPPTYLARQHRPGTPEGAHPDPDGPDEIAELRAQLQGHAGQGHGAVEARGYVVAHFLAAAEASKPRQNVWQCAPNPVWGMLRSRLDLPFHRALTKQSVANTLECVFSRPSPVSPPWFFCTSALTGDGMAGYAGTCSST